MNDLSPDRTGTVIESTGSRYRILLEDGTAAEATLRGKLRLKDVRTTNPVAVGDRVRVETSPEGMLVTEILPRRNYLIRKASNLSKEAHIIASNIDRALIVVTIASPATNTEFIDRALVTCEAYGIPAAIVLNKTDLVPAESVEAFSSIYRPAGYPVLPVCAAGGEGMEKLRSLVDGSVTLLTGNSGVGKSTIIRALVPGADARVGRISDHHRKGMHTTTFARMYPIPGGGIIDTPGIKGFGLIDIPSDEVFRYFPEFMAHAGECQFYNCTHTHEPGCAVTVAVETGAIAPERYVSYLKLHEEDAKYRS